jgi:Xaa-Pro aminopeptidase
MRNANLKTLSGFGENARKLAFLNPDGADRPLASPVPAETLARARVYRLARLRERLAKADCAAALLYDPVNIRYALDAPNMQVWTLHNAVRYALVLTEGPAILFELSGCEHLSADMPAIDEIRKATGWIYMAVGSHQEERIRAWAGEIDSLLRECGGGNRRLAIDRVDLAGLKALERLGIDWVDGQPLAEAARAIKSADEIELMRWSVRVCEAGLARMWQASRPGRTEQEIWAELQHENARSGGEWLESRLLAAGPRTNPWYSECSDHICREGELISVDTDMIGPYGYCADLSRSWTCGHAPFNPTQRGLYAAALEQIERNLALLKPGLGFLEFIDKAWKIPDRYFERRYGIALHGVGLCDEWPVVPDHPSAPNAYDGAFEAGMVVCVESLIGAEGTECVKLETQVLIAPDGAVRLDSFPWEAV